MDGSSIYPDKESTSLMEEKQGFQFGYEWSGMPVTHPCGHDELVVVHVNLELRGEVKARDINLVGNSTKMAGKALKQMRFPWEGEQLEKKTQGQVLGQHHKMRNISCSCCCAQYIGKDNVCQLLLPAPVNPSVYLPILPSLMP